MVHTIPDWSPAASWSTQNAWLQVFVAKVAEYMYGGWKYLTPDEGASAVARIEGQPGTEFEGLQVFARLESGRVVFAGRYPQGTHSLYGDYGTVKTACAPDRDPQAVAKQIGSRLLPQYMTRFVKAQEALLEIKTAESKRDATALMLAGKPARDGKFTTDLGKRGYAHVRVGYTGDSVSMEIVSVSPEQTKKILAILKED